VGTVGTEINAGQMIDFLFIRRFPGEPLPSDVRKSAAQHDEQQKRVDSAKRGASINFGPSFFTQLPKIAALVQPVMSRAETEQRQQQQAKRAERQHRADIYRTELNAMSYAEIESAYRDEIAKQDAEVKDEIERQLESPSGGPARALREWAHPEESPPDFQHYAMLAYWTASDCVALFLGKNPAWINSPSILASFAHTELGAEYGKLTETVRRAVEVGDLEKRAKPADVIKWARLIKLRLPTELSELFPMDGPDQFTSAALDGGVPTIGRRDHYEELQRAYNELSERSQVSMQSLGDQHKVHMNSLTANFEKALAEIRQHYTARLEEAHTERATANKETEALRTHLEKSGQDKPLQTRERESLRLIALLGAIQGFEYDPNKNNAAASQISIALENLGLGLSDDAIRGHLKAGAEMLPGDWRERFKKKPNSGSR
jgi:hypothetical protein